MFTVCLSLTITSVSFPFTLALFKLTRSQTGGDGAPLCGLVIVDFYNTSVHKSVILY